MDIQSVMETFAEWFAATNPNGGLFSIANGVQSQALSLTTTAGNSIQNNSHDSSQAAGKTLAVRCVVESVASIQYWDAPYANHGAGQIEVDRQASVPVHTVFHNLVEAVLQIFGYPKETAVTAKGSILIENWKPIRLEKVAQNPQKTVYDILGQINSFVTLKIQILRTSSCANAILSQMKEKLLQLLILQNREHILSSGCPLDQIMLKSMFRGVDYGSSVPSDDVIRKFEQWITNQYRQTMRPLSYASPLAQFPFPIGSPSSLHHDKGHIGSSDDRVHPALQTVQSQYPTQKTRMRTSFDAEHELPRLQKWFAQCQHPTRQTIMEYVSELNNLESRRGRKPLDVNNVVYWFKNARAALKRTEGRNQTNAPNNNSMNGYRSDSHSPCDTAVTSKESLGSTQSCDEDDVDDDDNRSEGEEGDDSLDARPSSSPVAPLSLTTHKANKRSRSSSPVDKIKQEPPDKTDRPASRDSPVHKSSKTNNNISPNDRAESESEEEDVDDDISETESIHMKPDPESRTSLFTSPSQLSLIPRSVGNPVFPLVPNSMFNHQFSMFTPYIHNMNMNMSRSIPHSSPQPHANNHNNYSDDKRKRNRTFIDPVSEVPCLESWFRNNTHPSHGLIMQYTEELNNMAYRQKFPKLEPKNVQFWFKNRRAKCKRLKSSRYDSITVNNNLSPQEYHQLAAALAGENYRMPVQD